MKRLTSRKFLLAIAAMITLAANEQWTELTALVLGYIGLNVAQKATEKHEP